MTQRSETDDPAAGRSRRRWSTIGATLTLTGTALALLAVHPASSVAAPQPKVTLCHRTNSDTNPYVRITVDANAVIKEGHGDHTGPVWSPGLKAQQIKWGDIIPPFAYNGGTYAGMNWTDAGRAIFSAGCAVPQAQTSTPPPTQTATSSAADTVTPAATGTLSATATTSAAATTSVAATVSNSAAVSDIALTSTSSAAGRLAVDATSEVAGSGAARATSVGVDAAGPVPVAASAGRHALTPTFVGLGALLVAVGMAGILMAARPWKRGTH